MAKKTEKSIYNTWDEISISLKELRDIESRIKTQEVNMNNDILVIKSSYEKRVGDDINKRDEIQKQIKLFTECHIDEFTDKKTKEFTFGKVGFRKSTEIVTRNVKAIIEACKQHNLIDMITVSEKLNKEVMATYDDKVLNNIGAKRKTSDKYFCEVEYEELGE